MSHKWDDELIQRFLVSYRKHKCLWNPYSPNYRNCSAKNEAFRIVLQELNVPRIQISDCFQQIEVIREKYKQEQLRIEKKLKSGKLHFPKVPWFELMSEMLSEVINDEENLKGGLPTYIPCKIIKENQSKEPNWLACGWETKNNVGKFHNEKSEIQIDPEIEVPLENKRTQVLDKNSNFTPSHLHIAEMNYSNWRIMAAETDAVRNKREVAINRIADTERSHNCRGKWVPCESIQNEIDANKNMPVNRDDRRINQFGESNSKFSDKSEFEDGCQVRSRFKITIPSSDREDKNLEIIGYEIRPINPQLSQKRSFTSNKVSMRKVNDCQNENKATQTDISFVNGEYDTPRSRSVGTTGNDSSRLDENENTIYLCQPAVRNDPVFRRDSQSGYWNLSPAIENKESIFDRIVEKFQQLSRTLQNATPNLRVAIKDSIYNSTNATDHPNNVVNNSNDRHVSKNATFNSTNAADYRNETIPGILDSTAYQSRNVTFNDTNSVDDPSNIAYKYQANIHYGNSPSDLSIGNKRARDVNQPPTYAGNMANADQNEIAMDRLKHVIDNLIKVIDNVNNAAWNDSTITTYQGIPMDPSPANRQAKHVNPPTNSTREAVESNDATDTSNYRPQPAHLGNTAENLGLQYSILRGTNNAVNKQVSGNRRQSEPLAGSNLPTDERNIRNERATSSIADTNTANIAADSFVRNETDCELDNVRPLASSSKNMMEYPIDTSLISSIVKTNRPKIITADSALIRDTTKLDDIEPLASSSRIVPEDLINISIPTNDFSTIHRG